MKKTLCLLGILAIVVFPTLTFASFDVSLKYGSRGDAVSELQDFLTDQNVYTGKVDGKFGLGTLRAVKAFQTANNLSVDGYFGKDSRATAQTLLAIELKPSNDAEVAETGTVAPVSTIEGCTSTTGFSTVTGHPCDGSTPVAKPVTDTGTQSALNSLTQQVQSLTQQVQTQTQVQQQIATNTTPKIQTPVVTQPVVPADTTPLTITRADASHKNNQGNAGTVGWRNGNTTGNLNDSCYNCLYVTTSKPTTIKVSYIDTANPFFHTDAWISSSMNVDVPALQQFASDPTNVTVYQDTTLSTSHIIKYSDMGLGNSKYYYSVEAIDASGKSAFQEFTTSYLDTNIYHWSPDYYLESGQITL